MNALGFQEAKRNLAFFGASGMQSRNGGCDDFCGFSRTLVRAHQFRECLFDDHFGSQ